MWPFNYRVPASGLALRRENGLYVLGIKDSFLEEVTSTAKRKAFPDDNGEKGFEGCGSSLWASQRQSSTENCQSREAGWGSVMREGRNQFIF